MTTSDRQIDALADAIVAYEKWRAQRLDTQQSAKYRRRVRKVDVEEPHEAEDEEMKEEEMTA